MQQVTQPTVSDATIMRQIKILQPVELLPNTRQAVICYVATVFQIESFQPFEFAQELESFFVDFGAVSEHLSKIFNGVAVIRQEGNRNRERFVVDSDACYRARRVSCFGKSIADLPASCGVLWEVDMLDPGDVVRVEEEALKVKVRFIVDVRE